uniref:Uncharacterized protein n=1 Tax=Cyphia dentariifolia TaxID=2041117 RepID=A0A291F3Y8_9ASTR|nr:hypothetical protein Cyp_den1Pt0744 [Cyphia dentariifolia]ATG26822.1 hypothetical protein Cyp_den1Pt0744 [Cyphia dentariifolia]
MVNPNRPWFLSADLVRRYLYTLLKPLGDEELTELFGAEGVEEFKDNANNLEKNWIFSEKAFLKSLYPFIKHFLKQEVEDFCDWGRLVWEQGELLEDRQSLKREQREVTFLYETMASIFSNGYFLESIRTSPDPYAYITAYHGFANLCLKILAKIEGKLLANKNQLDFLNQGQRSVPMLEYYCFIFKQLQRDPTKLSAEEDNRLFFFVLHIFLIYLSKKYSLFPENI